MQKRNAKGFGESGEELVVGQATPELMAMATPQEIIDVLINTQVIELYIHLYGEACQVHSGEDPEGYFAMYEGEHSYCTNECLDEAFSFGVEVKTDGTVVVFSR